MNSITNIYTSVNILKIKFNFSKTTIFHFFFKQVTRILVKKRDIKYILILNKNECRYICRCYIIIHNIQIIRKNYFGFYFIFSWSEYSLGLANK